MGKVIEHPAARLERLAAERDAAIDALAELVQALDDAKLIARRSETPERLCRAYERAGRIMAEYVRQSDEEEVD